MPNVFLAPTIGASYQAFDNNGLPLANGKIYTYIAGGTTPQATYTTSAGNVQNANPVILSTYGRPPSEIWFLADQTYRIDIKDQNDNLIKTYDNLGGIVDGPTLAGDNGADFVGFNQDDSGSVKTTVGAKLRTWKSVFDFLDSATCGYIEAGNTASQNRTTVTAAINAALATGKDVSMPYGTYATNGRIQIGPTYMNTLYGEWRGTIIDTTYTGDCIHIGATPGSTASGVVTGGGVENLQINQGATSGNAIRLLQTQKTTVKNIYVANDQARPHTATALILDGGGGSSYFNDINNFTSIGCDISVQLLSSGAGQVTRNYFTNINSVPYTNNTNGIGIKFTGNDGQDSRFDMVNIEAFNTAVKFATGAASYSDPHTQGTVWTNFCVEGADITHPAINCGDYSRENYFIGYGNGFASWVINDNPLTSSNFFGGIGQKYGTWTPSLSSTGVTFDYSTGGGIQKGTYIVEGNKFTFFFTLKCQYTITGSDTNAMTLAGFPVTAQNDSNLYFSGNFGYATGSVRPQMYVGFNSSTGVLWNGATALTPNAYFGGASSQKDLIGSIVIYV